jgi:hypothetical protein
VLGFGLFMPVSLRTVAFCSEEQRSDPESKLLIAAIKRDDRPPRARNDEIEACDQKGLQGTRHIPAAYAVKPDPHEFLPTRTPWAFTPSTFANEAGFGAAIRSEKN